LYHSLSQGRRIVHHLLKPTNTTSLSSLYDDASSSGRLCRSLVMYIGLFWCIYVSFICLICLIVIRPTKNTLPNSLHYDASSYSVCCSVLQCVAVCCSVLPCVAVCCSVLQCSVLQCSVLPPHIQVVFVGHFWCTCVSFIGLF